MALDRLKASVESHKGITEEPETETLTNEEDTSSETGQSEQNDNDSEDGETQETRVDKSQESVEELKTRLEKTERDRDNYRAAMLAIKAKKRALEPQKSIDIIEPEIEEQETIPISKQVVYETLYEINEQKALQNVINPKHADYLPELVDDSQYNEIIGYLPRNIDKSTEGGISKALKLAVHSWKIDKGIIDNDNFEKGKKSGMAAAKTAELASISNTIQGSNQQQEKQRTGRRILKTGIPITEWYK